jgi:hypothetical protein
MRTCTRASDLVGRVQDVTPVAAIWNAVVNQQAIDDLLGGQSAVGQVLPAGPLPDAIYLDTCTRQRPIAARMATDTTRATVIAMSLGGGRQGVAPLQCLHWGSCVQHLYAFKHSRSSFLCRDHFSTRNSEIAPSVVTKHGL